MTVFDAAILGVVEGLAEFLPIYSTGHLILANHLLQLQETDFIKSFDIAIQCGAILAVVVWYWRSFFDIEILKRLVVGFIPTGVIGLALYNVVKTHLLGNELVVLVSLALGGIALIVFEYIHIDRASATSAISDITYRQAFGIGLFQSIAIIPGVSRSASTIVGGLLLGLHRATIVEFSFLLAVPTMGAATALDLLKNYSTFSISDTGVLIVGFIAAFIVALGVIRFFLEYVRTRTFIPFGIYRVLIAAFFFFVVLT
jgi:undecaprenyl-diphosphatase